MKWYEYRMAVDELHASDELKAKLLAMEQPDKEAAPQHHKSPLRLLSRRTLGLAACAAVCVAAIGAAAFSLTGAAGGTGMEPAAQSGVAMYSTARAAVADYSLEDTNGLGADGGSAVLTSGEARTAGTAAQSKIIYTATLRLESRDYDAARAAITAALTDAGGYVETSDENTDASSSARSLLLTLRVPQANYDSFLTAASQAGSLVSKSEQAEDVTTQYMDIEARLANLTAQRTRLQELQAGAETLADLLEVESKLSDVQYQLESWQSQLDWYDDQVSCCTVYVQLDEVQAYTAQTRSFAERFAAALGGGWSGFVAAVQQVVIAVAGAWPVVVIIAAAAAAVIAVRKRKR